MQDPAGPLAAARRDRTRAGAAQTGRAPGSSAHARSARAPGPSPAWLVPNWSNSVATVCGLATGCDLSGRRWGVGPCQIRPDGRPARPDQSRRRPDRPGPPGPPPTPGAPGRPVPSPGWLVPDRSNSVATVCGLATGCDLSGRLWGCQTRPGRPHPAFVSRTCHAFACLARPCPGYWAGKDEQGRQRPKQPRQTGATQAESVAAPSLRAWLWLPSGAPAPPGPSPAWLVPDRSNSVATVCGLATGCDLSGRLWG